MQLGGTNICTRTGKRLGSANTTFTAMICSLGTCRIFSTTPYAPRPSSTMGSRSSAFTSKFCRRQKREFDRKFSSVQSLSRVRLCDPVDHSTPGLPVHHQLPEFTQTHVHRVGDAMQPSHPLSSPSPLAPNPSQHQGFSSESTLCMRWPKYWSFSFNISPANEHSGLIAFRMDWLDLLAVPGTLKSLLQHHGSEASIL